jgi:hypothetical protein
MTEQFEQAKRELEDKARQFICDHYWLPRQKKPITWHYIEKNNVSYDIYGTIDLMVAFATALLEQHKEVMKDDFISFANHFHRKKERIKRGECPIRPDEIYNEWLNLKNEKK